MAERMSMPGGAALQRVCFSLRLRPEQVDEYRRRHQAVWPEMRSALTSAGWRNYSLFLDRDGTVIGYLECDDFERATAAMAESEVNARWQESMAPLFDLDGGTPDRAMSPIPEIFHLP